MYGFKEIDAATLAQWLEEGVPVKLVDTRTLAEMNQGMIPGAEALPLHLVPVKLPEVREGEKLVMYCRSGARSAQACTFLAQRGMSEVYNLRGGIISWAASGLPLVAPQRDKMAG